MHEDEESCHVRQKNEIQALQAIFMEDFVVEASPVDDQSKVLEFVLRLAPQQSTSGDPVAHATISMRLSLGAEYPLEAPRIRLEDGRGLSQKDIADLQRQLEDLCRCRPGEEMGFVLAHHVQTFLAERNKTPRFQSFHDEMLHAHRHNIERTALAELSRRVQEDELQLNTFREEVQLKQQVLLNELRRTKGSSPHPLLDNLLEDVPAKLRMRRCLDTAAHKDGEPATSEVLERHKCAFQKEKQIAFGNRVFHCGPCLGGCRPHRNVFLAVDSNTKQSLAITHLTVPCVDMEARRKQVSLVEQEFRLLQKVPLQRHLVPYVAFKFEVVDQQLHVYAAEEFVHGISLNFYLQRKTGAGVEVLRHVTEGLMQALLALHGANIVHKNLRHSCVFVDSQAVVRLAGYSLEARAIEVLSVPDDRPTLSVYPAAPGRGGKRADLHRLGILLWSLFQGRIVNDSDELGAVSAPLLRDFIGRCIGSDDRQRVHIDDLAAHPFLRTPLGRGQLQLTAHHRHAPAVDQSLQPSGDDRSTEPLPPLSSPLAGGLAGPSRIHNEFETLNFLGSGGFGDVLQVRNKLDGNIYAIKRILIDAKSRQLNRKMTREVKLLSRLNHENVVRYYYSWVETEQAPTASADQPQRRDAASDASDASGSSDSDSTGGWFQKPMLSSSSSSSASSSSSSGGIGFEEVDTEPDESSDEEESTCPAPKKKGSADVTDSGSRRSSLQFMYIQMEYCEKSTLRTAIDLSELCGDKVRVWRLFREMVEGLAYIHQQGVIHRDLKPVNIFLDSVDRVKIGDFGLATSSRGWPASKDTVDAAKGGAGGQERLLAACGSDLASGSFTGEIGTALYVAPEMKTIAESNKAAYNAKVDIYSLGIILFEMCHPPLTTGMERVRILTNLRQPDIGLPHSDYLTLKEVKVMHWLLNHNAALRPSSAELLQSPYLPPPQLEEAELHEMVRQTLTNTHSKAYKHLVASCFQQTMTPSEDVVYYMDVAAPAGPVSDQAAAHLGQTLHDVFVGHCRRRGAIPFQAPLLSPKVSTEVRKVWTGQQPQQQQHQQHQQQQHQQHQQNPQAQVQLMTSGGGVVTLPVELRTPLARFVARWAPTRSTPPWFKRYAVASVYGERKFVGLHPRSAQEMAFDVVTPAPASPLADAEVLATVSAVLNDGRLRLRRPPGLELGHRTLLDALLVHCGVPEDKRPDLCQLLESCSPALSEAQVQVRAAKLGLPRQPLDLLLILLQVQGPLTKVVDKLTAVTSRKGEAASLARHALHELQVILEHAECMGLRGPAVVSTRLAVNGYAAHSALVFRFCSTVRVKTKKVVEVLASGGRYDALVASFRVPVVTSRGRGSGVQPAAVGALLYVDKIVSAMKEDAEADAWAPVDVVVATVGHQPLTRQQAALVSELWNGGVRATTLDHCQNLEEIQAWCREKNVANIVLLKDGEAATARLKTWEKDRYTERKMSLAELMETLTASSGDSAEAADFFAGPGAGGVGRSNSVSEPSTAVKPAEAVGGPLVNFHMLAEEKLPLHARRRHEMQILKHLQPALQNFNSRVQVEIVAIEGTAAVVQSLLIALYVDPADTKAVSQAISQVVEKHRRQRKYLERVYEQLLRLRFDKHVPVLVIYGVHDNSHRLLM